MWHIFVLRVYVCASDSVTAHVRYRGLWTCVTYFILTGIIWICVSHLFNYQFVDVSKLSCIVWVFREYMFITYYVWLAITTCVHVTFVPILILLCEHVCVSVRHTTRYYLLLCLCVCACVMSQGVVHALLVCYIGACHITLAMLQSVCVCASWGRATCCVSLCCARTCGYACLRARRLFMCACVSHVAHYVVYMYMCVCHVLLCCLRARGVCRRACRVSTSLRCTRVCDALCVFVSGRTCCLCVNACRMSLIKPLSNMRFVHINVIFIEWSKSGNCCRVGFGEDCPVVHAL